MSVAVTVAVVLSSATTDDELDVSVDSAGDTVSVTSNERESTVFAPWVNRSTAGPVPLIVSPVNGAMPSSGSSETGPARTPPPDTIEATTFAVASDPVSATFPNSSHTAITKNIGTP